MAAWPQTCENGAYRILSPSAESRGSATRGPMVRLLCGFLLILFVGCTTPECEGERLPFGGVVLIDTAEDPYEQLFQLMRYAARKDCCDTLYGQLSAQTRDEHSETKFCLFWDTIDIPEPFDYKLADVLKDGIYSGSVPGPNAGEELVYVSYPPDGQPGKNLLAQILVISEADEQGRIRPRIALQEQVAKIEAGDARYYLDAGY